jgi:hypothetical protein
VKLIGRLYGGLGAITASVLFDSSERHLSTVLVVGIGNIIAVALWILLCRGYRRSRDPAIRHDLLVYGIVIPVVFYLSGFAYRAYVATR